MVLLLEWMMIPQENFCKMSSYCQGVNEPGLDGQVWPLPQSPQPNMHFNIVRGSKTISSILKTTALSAPSFIASFV